MDADQENLTPEKILDTDKIETLNSSFESKTQIRITISLDRDSKTTLTKLYFDHGFGIGPTTDPYQL